jgi:hypothetical protein
MGFDAAARAIGISPDQLRQELPGKSLADVAKAHNVDPTAVANAIKADATARIDRDVSAGRITAERAAQIKQDLSDRVDRMMTRQVPADAPQRGPGPRQGGAPMQGDAPLSGDVPFRAGPRF